jgi:hypothetical protein
MMQWRGTFSAANAEEDARHDFYSIWFNFTTNFFISEEKV